MGSPAFRNALTTKVASFGASPGENAVESALSSTAHPAVSSRHQELEWITLCLAALYA
jgi:hypothetical protein